MFLTFFVTDFIFQQYRIGFKGEFKQIRVVVNYQETLRNGDDPYPVLLLLLSYKVSCSSIQRKKKEIVFVCQIVCSSAEGDLIEWQE